MTAYLTPASCKKLQRFCAFFLLALAFSARSLASQDLSKLTPEESKQKRDEFVNAALAYRGTPYMSAGTTGRGMDCSGLIYRTGIDVLGIRLPRSASSLSQYAQKIEDSELEPGDLLFFNTTGGISHTGIYIGDGEFVHSASSGPRTGVIVSKLSESYWKRTYRFAGRIFPSAAQAQAAVSGAAGADNLSSEDADSSANGDDASEGNVSDSSGEEAAASAASALGIKPDSAKDSKGRDSPYGLRVELRATALWDFNIEEYLIRGTTISAIGQWRGQRSFYPGIAAGFTWDTRHDTMAVPLCLSVGLRNGLAFFAGTQFVFYSEGKGSTDIVFPGLVGVSWTSPYKDLGAVKIGFYQSIECVFVRQEGIAGTYLSDTFRLSTGVSFAIGK